MNARGYGVSLLIGFVLGIAAQASFAAEPVVIVLVPPWRPESPQDKPFPKFELVRLHR
jgi:hypothetical protein